MVIMCIIIWFENNLKPRDQHNSLIQFAAVFEWLLNRYERQTESNKNSLPS